MPRADVGSEPPPRRAAHFWRVTGLVAAALLTALGVWLLVTSSSQKHLELGVLSGLWGLVLAGFALFGGRHPIHAAGDGIEPGQGLEIRASSALDRAEDALARRDYEQRLEQMLRREIQAGLAREVDLLRSEIASLRGELLEKVGGQLRLERIETTRVIGSDIEALQDEVRRLKFAPQSTEDFADFTVAPVSFAKVETARPASSEAGPPRPASLLGPRSEQIAVPAMTWPPSEEPPAAPAARWDAPASPAPAYPAAAAPVPAPEPVSPSVPAPPPAPPVAQPSQPPVPPPLVAAPVPTWLHPATAVEPPATGSGAPEPVAAEPSGPAASPVPGTDPFASMPRLRPFRDFEPNPGGLRAAPPPSVAPSSAPAPDVPDPGARPARHSTGEAESQPEHAAGGRRRRSAGDGDGHDMLARILQREGAP